MYIIYNVVSMMSIEFLFLKKKCIIIGSVDGRYSTHVSYIVFKVLYRHRRSPACEAKPPKGEDVQTRLIFSRCRTTSL